MARIALQFLPQGKGADKQWHVAIIFKVSLAKDARKTVRRPVRMRRSIKVEPLNGVAPLGQVLGGGAAHGTETDDNDSLVHVDTLAQPGQSQAMLRLTMIFSLEESCLRTSS